MKKEDILIQNINIKLNKNEFNYISFKDYIKFIDDEEIYEYFSKFILFLKNNIKDELLNNKNDWVKSIIFIMENDLELYNFLISSIIFKNIIKSGISYNENTVSECGNHYVNSDILLSNISKDIIGIIVYYDIKSDNISHKNLKLDIKLYFFRIISKICSIENSMIISKKIRIYDKGSTKTPLFYSLNKEIWYVDYMQYSNININKPKLKNFKNNTYILGDGFWNCDPIFKHNNKTNSMFILKDDEVLNKLIKQRYYIDEENLNFALDLIKKKIENEDIEKEIIKYRKIIKFDNNKEIQRKLSELYTYFNVYVLHKLNKNIKSFYFKIEIDFRGRAYYNSPIGVTFSKLNRFLYNFGYIKKKDLIMEDVDIAKDRIEKNNLIIEKTLDVYNIIKDKLNKKICYWLLISIGKNFIEKSKEKVIDEQFLLKGYEYIINRNKIELEIELEIELYNYINIIKNLDNEFFKLSLVSKDATASVIQNYMRILGPKDDFSLKISNINSGYEWYDPYSVIINIFLKINKLENLKESKLFNRKNLKKTIMTIPYEASLLTCLDYFIEELKKKDYEYINDFYIKKELRNEEVNKIIEIFKKFYRYVKYELEKDILYSKETKEISYIAMSMIKGNEQIPNDYRLVLVNNMCDNVEKKLMVHDKYKTSYSSLIYYKIKTRYIDIIIKPNKRYTKEIKDVNLNEIDIRKISQSIKPNYLHFHDAEFLRLIIKNMINTEMAFIHDCILLSINDVPKLINTCNKIMNMGVIKRYSKKNNLEIFSIFILL